MDSQYIYPVICTDKVVVTANFYEDFFDFVPVREVDNSYILLERNGFPDQKIAIVDVNHSDIPEERRNGAANIQIRYTVKNVKEMWDHLYMEGLTLLSKPKMCVCGCPRFLTEDPSGNIISVVEECRTYENATDEYNNADTHDEMVA